MRLFDSNIPSGNAYKVHLLLKQLGRSYETVDLDLLATPSETRRPEFLAKNPNGRIPLLELDDGSTLPESNAIRQTESQIARLKNGGQAALAVMAKHLDTHSFFVDERYTIADIALFA